MLINISNHPSEKWSAGQRNSAIKNFSEILDISFPQIPPDADAKYVSELAQEYKDRCIEMLKENSKDVENAVHIMGEFTFTFTLVSLLFSEGIKCVASTTTRIVKELENNKREVTFEFARFREYKLK
jgi:hypothetical protein